MEVVQSRKYQELKRKLDALHYCAPLSLDSTPLVDQILKDLLKTTEGFQQLKKQLNTARQETEAAKQGVIPL